MTDTSSVQSRGLESGSLIVGRIRPPMAMWAALEGITTTTAVRNGVLIIFSQNIRGRIGVFCNKYISGAVIEPAGENGIDAVRTLLSIKGGMFGFRACMADEWDEVSQSLGMDIDELLLSRTDNQGMDQALRALMVPGSQLVRGSDAGLIEEEINQGITSESLTGGAGDTDEEHGDDLPPPESASDGDFSYLDWFADQMGERDSLPKFRQVLMTVAPKAPPAEPAPDQDATEEHLPVQSMEPESDLQLYGRLLASEQEKVIRDIEKSLERGRTADGAGSVEEAVSELQLLSDFIQSEQERQQKWAGLDDIPTPKVGGGAQAGARLSTEALRTSQRMRAVSIEETGQLSQDVDTLLQTSMTRLTPPKDFVKPTGNVQAHAPAVPRIDVTVRWWERPPVIAAFSILAIGGIVFAINAFQSTRAFEDTLRDARRGLRDNPIAAANVMTKAIRGHEANPRGYFYRGIAYGAAGDYDKSMSDLDAAFMRGEEPKIVFLAKAAAALRANKFEEAMENCNEVIKRDPSNQQATSLKQLAEELKKAAAPPPVVATKPVEEDPKAVKKPVKPGKVDMSVISDALPSAQPKLPSDPNKLVAIGYQYLRAGDRASAQAVFVEAVKRAPNNADARRYLAHILAEDGNADAAVSQFSALVTLNGLRATDALAYGRALADSGNTEHAIEVLAHFVDQVPTNLDMRIELIRLYTTSGDSAKATALYQASLPLANTEERRALLDDARGGDGGTETIHIKRR